MKILDFDNYISEKKSISPLTVKQIKGLTLKGVFDTMESFPKSIDDFNIEKVEPSKQDLSDGVFTVSNYNNQIWIYLDVQNFKRLYDQDRINDILKEFYSGNGYFVALTKLGFFEHLLVSGYKNDLTYPDKYFNMIKMYKTNFSWNLMENTEDLRNVLQMVRREPLFFKD